MYQRQSFFPGLFLWDYNKSPNPKNLDGLTPQVETPSAENPNPKNPIQEPEPKTPTPKATINEQKWEKNMMTNPG